MGLNQILQCLQIRCKEEELVQTQSECKEAKVREAEAIRHSHELEQMLDNMRQEHQELERAQQQRVHQPTRKSAISTAISVVKPTVRPSAMSGSPHCLWVSTPFQCASLRKRKFLYKCLFTMTMVWDFSFLCCFKSFSPSCCTHEVWLVVNYCTGCTSHGGCAALPFCSNTSHSSSFSLDSEHIYEEPPEQVWHLVSLLMK